MSFYWKSSPYPPTTVTVDSVKITDSDGNEITLDTGKLQVIDADVKTVLDSIILKNTEIDTAVDYIKTQLSSMDTNRNTEYLALLTELQQKLESSDLSTLATSAKQDTAQTSRSAIALDVAGIEVDVDIMKSDIDSIQTDSTAIRLGTDYALTWNKTQFRTNNIGTIFTNTTGSTILLKMIVCSVAASTRNGNLKLNSTAAGAGNAFTSFDNDTESQHYEFEMILANNDYIYYYESSADYIQGVIFYAELAT